MKTTHQLAKELLKLPDVQLVVEYWIMMDSTHEMVAEMTNYDPKNTAIIWQKPNKSKVTPPKSGTISNTPRCACPSSSTSLDDTDPRLS